MGGCKISICDSIACASVAGGAPHRDGVESTHSLAAFTELLDPLVSGDVADGINRALSSEYDAVLFSFWRQLSIMAGMHPLILVMIGSSTGASSRVNASSRASHKASSRRGLIPWCSSILVRTVLGCE
jgi:hypothetical protein